MKNESNCSICDQASCPGEESHKVESVSPAPAQEVKRALPVRKYKLDYQHPLALDGLELVLASDYASLSAELERVKQELIKYMGWFDAAQQNETLFKQQLSAAREALEKIAKEVAGILSYADIELREVLGNTNVAIFREKVDQALAALNGGK